MDTEDASAFRDRAEKTILICSTAVISAISGDNLRLVRVAHCWAPRPYVSSKWSPIRTAHNTAACWEEFSTLFQNQVAMSGTVVFTSSCGTARWTHAIFLIERSDQRIHAFRRFDETNLVRA